MTGSEVREGLTGQQVLQARAEHGSNTLKEVRTESFFRKLLSNLSDPIIRVLLFALLLHIVLNFGQCDYFEVGGIVVSVVLATVVSTVSECGSESAFRKLQQQASEKRCRVIRDGETREIPAEELVVGDVVELGYGEMIMADGYLTGGSLRVDQSALNGENKECKKSPGGARDGLLSPSGLFRGTLVASGSGRMCVSAVGDGTVYGGLATGVQAETRPSPMKIRLAKLASDISKIGYICAVLVALSYFIYTFFVAGEWNPELIRDRFADRELVLGTLLHMLTLMITVIVVAVPEGLPMMMTVVLSANMRRMLRDRVLVRKMVGIETAGSMNVLFTDKTGTLTEGNMQFDGFLTCAGIYAGRRTLSSHAGLAEGLAVGSILCTESRMADGRAAGGNATDRAMLAQFHSFKLPEGCRVTERQAFDSALKYASVCMENGTYPSFFKGAPEILEPSVKWVMEPDGTVRPIGRGELQSLIGQRLEAAGRGARVLMLAYGMAPALLPGQAGGLILVGYLCLRDRPRRDARRSVEELHRAGVSVVMVTGDAPQTAAAIGAECGLYDVRAGHLVLTGEELHRLSDEALEQCLPRLRIVCRALPEDKTRLVRAAQALGWVVGMTGDGVNDAPALRLADVGFAMGSGTDIAKEAADIVILDDSVQAIARTVLYGRTIFRAIRKFITFQLIMNLSAVGVSLIGQFIGIGAPVTIVQMLWVNIIMDTLGGLAFAGEAPLRAYMRERPKRRDERILSSEMLHQILITGAFTLLLCVLFLALPVCRIRYGYSEADPVRFLTVFFALFIFAGIFNCFSVRTERLYLFANIGGNKPFLVIMALIACIQILMIYFGGAVFRTVPLTPAELGGAVALAFTVVPVEWIRKFYYRLRRPRRESGAVTSSVSSGAKGTGNRTP